MACGAPKLKRKDLQAALDCDLTKRHLSVLNQLQTYQYLRSESLHSIGRADHSARQRLARYWRASTLPKRAAASHQRTDRQRHGQKIGTAIGLEKKFSRQGPSRAVFQQARSVPRGSSSWSRRPNLWRQGRRDRRRQAAGAAVAFADVAQHARQHRPRSRSSLKLGSKWKSNDCESCVNSVTHAKSLTLSF